MLSNTFSTPNSTESGDIEKRSSFATAASSRTPSISKPPDSDHAKADELGEQPALGPDRCDERSARPSGPNPADFPDGGMKAWSVVLGGWCCLFSSFGWINCIGVFQDYYQKNELRTYSPSTVAWVSSAESAMMFVGAPIFGKIFDDYGSRYMLLFGTFFHVFGLMMTSLASTYYQIFLAQSICSALGASAIFYAATNPVGTWFFKRRALAFGIMSSGSSLGGVLVPIMIERLIPHIGFAWTMRACAFLFLGLLVVANLTVESRLKPNPTRFNVMDFFRPFKEIPFLCVALGSFFFFWGLFLPTNFIILEAQYYGMSTRLAGYLLAILNAASIFGRILPGWLGDRVGRFNVMIVTTVITTVISLALWIPAKSNAPIIVFAAFFGFTSGTFVSMIPALMAQISDVRQIGRRNGTNFFVIAIAALTGNPIAGVLITKNGGGYLYLQIFGGITMFIGTLFFVAARTALCGFSWKKI